MARRRGGPESPAHVPDPLPAPQLPRLALTAGEPAGIGPDLAVEAAARPLAASLLVYGDPALLAARAALLGRPLRIVEHDWTAPVPAHRPDQLCVRPVPLAVPATPGRMDLANAAAVLASIRLAVADCMAGRLDALVTAPVSKAVINEAGIPFTGHTEYLGGLCGARLPVMMLMSGELRVVLVTTHLPLARVSAAITPDRLESTLLIAEEGLRRLFGIAGPRLLVCGLNPHAGEQGHLGREEIEVIEPVLRRLRGRGLRFAGPVAADTAFTTDSLRDIDAVVAMYHDQGLPPLKARGFGNIVNVTLGLPIIRTSVDHGTALLLAGTGRARPDSLFAALECACRMVRAATAATQAGPRAGGAES
jgi:4-hydroxythreonine-4-phosphate dehydrogenase